MKKITIFLKEIGNIDFLKELEMKKFILDIQEKYKLVLKDKRILINEDEKYYSFFATYENLEIYFHYWGNIKYGYVEINGSIDLFNIWDELKNRILPKNFDIKYEN